MAIFFVGRTDVSGDSGLQRAFGAFDSVEAAQRFADNLRRHMAGMFVVFEGVMLSDAGQREDREP